MAAPSAAPSARSPPAVPAPAAPPPGLVIARWMYVDEAHTHEVHAGLRPGPHPAFVVKESAFHNENADEVIEQASPMESPWEAQLFHWQLECRLALMGVKYWRHDTREPGWRVLVAPQGIPQIDTREVAVSPYHGRVIFHHFHNRKLGDDKVLVAIPDDSTTGRRYLVALASFRFPNGADADIQLLHAHLPESPTKSLIMREHMALKEKNYEKLVWGQDFMLAHGGAWSRETGQVYAQLLQRISEGTFGHADDKREAIIDPLYTDFINALTDPRLLELQSRYLTPEEQATALAGGDKAIRKIIASKRERAPSEEQHKLTIIEASLLARDQLRPGQRSRVDPEVAALVRRFSFYL
jgi:hypothetical protein